MKSEEFNFSFKGARQYIQGPDIFNECTRFLQEQCSNNFERIEFVIHRMTDSNLVPIICEQETPSQPNALIVAEFSCQAENRHWKIQLQETGNRPNGRNPYDESAVVDHCRVDVEGRYIVLERGETPYSVMETLVSMNKALHLQVFPDMAGSWVFCRWSSPRWPLGASLNGVRIQLIQTLGTRLTRAEVSREGNFLGHIYFSARPSK